MKAVLLGWHGFWVSAGLKKHRLLTEVRHVTMGGHEKCKLKFWRATPKEWAMEKFTQYWPDCCTA